MILGLGELADAVHERERFAEVGELERALERIVHLVPAIQFGHQPSIYDRALTMTVSEQDAIARPLEGSRSDIPVRELVVAGFFGPVANGLVALLLPLRVPPVALVLANSVIGILAAVAIGLEALILAALLLQLKTVLDNADGRLARASGRASLTGRYLDTEIDLVVNNVLFAALVRPTGEPLLAAAALVVLTLTLSVDFNLVELYREVHGQGSPPPPASGSKLERALAGVYRVVFAPQDRLVRAISLGRLERMLGAEPDPARRRDATLAYHDRASLAVLANLGLSTQLVALGACLVLGVPILYLWLALGQILLLPLVQLRRERLARRADASPARCSRSREARSSSTRRVA
jgi:phosphatidylglycerophosphate synthase